jgi:hypothetical protein
MLLILKENRAIWSVSPRLVAPGEGGRLNNTADSQDGTMEDEQVSIVRASQETMNAGAEV